MSKRKPNIAKEIARRIVDCFKRGGKVLIFGNGGSLADASHFAAEFHDIGSVIALNDPAKITSIGNDDSFECIFSQQVFDLGKPDDLVIGISSSGKSRNVIAALVVADNHDIEAIDLPRKGKNTQEVQNYQYQLLHDVYLEVRKEMK